MRDDETVGARMVYELPRLRNASGHETTVYVVRHPRAATRVRVAWFPDAVRLDAWCAASGTPDAIVAGFFLCDPWRPLGEVRIDGAAVPHEPVEGAVGAAARNGAGRRRRRGDGRGATSARSRSGSSRPARCSSPAGERSRTPASTRASAPARASSTPASRPVVTALLFKGA